MFTTALTVALGVPDEGLSATLPVDGAPGVSVIPPEDVLEFHTFRAPDGALVFVDDVGIAYALIEDANDVEILNPGDGSFHAFDVDGVVSTIEAIPFEVRSGLSMTVFVLPYPRRGIVSSTVSESAVFLSPGVQAIEDDPTLHSIVTHEVGHSWQKLYLSNQGANWQEYVTLRGLEDDTTFFPEATLHAYRPGEIFAEDFRVLFGDTWAKGTGEVENPELSPPGDDPTLSVFFNTLVNWAYTTSEVAIATAQISARVFPNPVGSGQQVILEFGDEGHRNETRSISIIDARGRRVGHTEVNTTGRISVHSAWGNGIFWLREDSGHYEPVRLNVISTR